MRGFVALAIVLTVWAMFIIIPTQVLEKFFEIYGRQNV